MVRVGIGYDVHALVSGRKLILGGVQIPHQKGLDGREIYHGRANVPDAPADPHYTIRAWRAVVTYLLRRPEFLYE